LHYIGALMLRIPLPVEAHMPTPTHNEATTATDATAHEQPVITITPSTSLKLQQRHTHTHTQTHITTRTVNIDQQLVDIHAQRRGRGHHTRKCTTPVTGMSSNYTRTGNADAEAATSTGNFRKHELPPRKATLLHAYTERSTGSITSTLPSRRFVAASHGSHPQTLQKSRRTPRAVRNTNTAASTQRVPFDYYTYFILTFDIKRRQGVVLRESRCQRCCTVSTNAIACDTVPSSTTCCKKRCDTSQRTSRSMQLPCAFVLILTSKVQLRQGVVLLQCRCQR
jgi:hypothetical protein